MLLSLFDGDPVVTPAPKPKAKPARDYHEEPEEALTRSEISYREEERRRYYQYQQCGGGYRIVRKSPRHE